MSCLIQIVGTKIRWILVCSLVLLSSCSKKDPQTATTTTVVTSQDLKQFLLQTSPKEFPDFFIADSQYALPSRSWVVVEFSQILKKFQWDMHTQQYASQDNDCDDFARGAAFLGQLLHHNTSSRLKDTGLAIGEFWFHSDRLNGHHAINIIIVKEANKMAIIYFEPQTQRIIQLTSREELSCTFVRF